MATRFLRIGTSFILLLSPFFPITEMVFPEVVLSNFGGYLAFGLAIGVLMLMLAMVVSRKGGVYHPPANVVIGLCFLVGILVLFPLHLGPPREGPALLQNLAIERFRYAMLLLGVFIYAMANYSILTMLDMHNNAWGRTAACVVLLAALINLWDNFDSITFGSQMKTWIATGKRAEDFFPLYNYHTGVRTFGRALLYVVSAMNGALLWRHNIIAGWRACILVLFCITGLVFCLLFTLNRPIYYFPFMVPAIALAPTYWTGLILLTGKISVGIIPKPD